MLQIKIKNFIPRKLFKMRILFDSESLQVLMRLNCWMTKLKGLLLIKIITLKLITLSKSNQILVRWVAL